MKRLRNLKHCNGFKIVTRFYLTQDIRLEAYYVMLRQTVELYYQCTTNVLLMYCTLCISYTFDVGEVF